MLLFGFDGKASDDMEPKNSVAQLVSFLALPHYQWVCQWVVSSSTISGDVLLSVFWVYICLCAHTLVCVCYYVSLSVLFNCVVCVCVV